MKKAAFAFALLLASFALVACGGSDDSDTTDTGSASGGTTQESGEEAGSGNEESSAGEGLKFEADPGGELAYTSDTASWGPGEVTVEFNNPASVPHNVAIESSGGKEVGKTDVVTESSATTTVDLKPGKYTFYCSVPGHREAGMEGTLTVK